ncbi:hypothetical protein QE449_002767 [Rhodococcus sp. SORGH_AS303]|nr:hypothetical protein [Rhodococcus sp. SORGH_AS_0303]
MPRRQPAPRGRLAHPAAEDEDRPRRPRRRPGVAEHRLPRHLPTLCVRAVGPGRVSPRRWGPTLRHSRAPRWRPVRRACVPRGSAPHRRTSTAVSSHCQERQPRNDSAVGGLRFTRPSAAAPIAPVTTPPLCPSSVGTRSDPGSSPRPFAMAHTRTPSCDKPVTLPRPCLNSTHARTPRCSGTRSAESASDQCAMSDMRMWAGHIKRESILVWCRQTPGEAESGVG